MLRMPVLEKIALHIPTMQGDGESFSPGLDDQFPNIASASLWGSFEDIEVFLQKAGRAFATILHLSVQYCASPRS